jgi:hypothetical protein
MAVGKFDALFFLKLGCHGRESLPSEKVRFGFIIFKGNGSKLTINANESLLSPHGT